MNQYYATVCEKHVSDRTGASNHCSPSFGVVDWPWSPFL